ncbi:MAG: cyanophycin synthetase [Candidatus Cloacimonadota bacterium]|nr:cyanophycin synthetase [Candidatus Cloacimonadota bacterium]
METVDEINGVIFVNDTKATNTDSVKYALNSFDNPIHLIIGGSGKGEDYSKLNRYIKNSCEKLYLIGASSDEMFEVFRNIKIPIEKHSIFESSIRSAFANARRGEIVLLSPACASYDMFTNFEDRGNQFKQIVRKIKNEK